MLGTVLIYMDTKTGNLLIVKFMGGKIKKGWENSLVPMYEFEKPPKSTGWCVSYSETWLSGEDFVEDCYHTSYDWIMPVVSKIESLGGDENEFDIFGNCVQLGDKEFVGKTKIEAIWEAVVWWVSLHCG